MKRCPYRKIQSNFGGDIKDYFAECIGEDCVAFKTAVDTIFKGKDLEKKEYKYCTAFKCKLD